MNEPLENVAIGRRVILDAEDSLVALVPSGHAGDRVKVPPSELGGIQGELPLLRKTLELGMDVLAIGYVNAHPDPFDDPAVLSKVRNRMNRHPPVDAIETPDQQGVSARQAAVMPGIHTTLRPDGPYQPAATVVMIRQ